MGPRHALVTGLPESVDSSLMRRPLPSLCQTVRFISWSHSVTNISQTLSELGSGEVSAWLPEPGLHTVLQGRCRGGKPTPS